MLANRNPPPPFTIQDAQALIQLVQSAPLANLTHARNVDQLCLRAQTFFAEVFGMQQAKAQTAAAEALAGAGGAPRAPRGGKKKADAEGGAGSDAGADSPAS